MNTRKDYNLLGPAGIQYDASLTGLWRIVRPLIDESSCIKCRTCEKFCPVEAITVSKEHPIKILWDYCKGCGICANECPKNCISMIPENGGKQ